MFIMPNFIQQKSMFANHMFFMRRKKFKIFNLIIKFISVKMMYRFIGLQVPTKMFLHYKTMFVNSIIFTFMGMLWRINCYVSFCFSSTPFPTGVFLYGSVKSHLSHFFNSFFRINSLFTFIPNLIWKFYPFIPRGHTSAIKKGFTFHSLGLAFHRTKLSSFLTTWGDFKFFFTKFTNKINHIYSITWYHL